MPAWIDALNSAAATESFAQAREFAHTLWATFASDHEFRAFARAVRLWQTDFTACADIRRCANALVRRERGSREALCLLTAIAAAPPEAPMLYRGLAEPFPYWEVLARYMPGSTVDISVASFTSEYLRALEFAWLAQEANGGTEVVFLLRQGANAVRIDLLAPDDIHWREREWLTGGRLIVDSAAYLHEEERVEVELTQEGYFNAS
jgi:hypothetical protein